MDDAPMVPDGLARTATDPAADREDLAPVVDRLDGASVVGLGVATHGTRECFAVSDRLLRALVERGDVRTLAVEADPAAVLALDDSVAGEGPATAALTTLDDWMWSTEGVRSALEWLRAFNEGRPPADRVRVRGVDLVSPASGAAALLELLPSVDAPVASDLRETLTDLADGDPEMDVDAIPRENQVATADAAARLDDAVDGTDETAARVAHLRRALDGSLEWYDAVVDLPERPHPDGMAVRDRVMAENTRDLLDRRAGAVALLAHAGHVQRGRFDDGMLWSEAETMGERLSESIGADYRTVGTDVTGGTVRAEAPGAESAPPHRSFDLPTLDEGTLASAADPDGEAVVVDLDAASLDRLRTRYVGTVFDPDADAETFVLETAPSSFDAVVCLGETRASTVVGQSS